MRRYFRKKVEKNRRKESDKYDKEEERYEE
jgi:hypothetical protein